MNADAKTLDRDRSLRGVPDGMLIDCEWSSATSGRTFEVRNPATGRVIATVPEGGKEDIDRAVQAARRSFDTRVWRGMSASERAKILWRVADLIDANSEEIVRAEFWTTACHRRNFHAFTMREPIGVAGLIIPWNGPFTFACSKLSVALAAGCSCVLKPAEETPLNALRLGKLLEEAGVPRGVVNIVTGFGKTAGAALAAHPGVDKIGFTGSTEVGRAIIEASAGNMKKLTLELGGKSPVVVLEDADLQKTLVGVAMGVFTNSGQICIAGSRVYAHRSVYEPMVEGLAGAARALKVGSGLEPDTQIGPLISEKQLDRVGGLIRDGVASGAELVAGGERVGREGYFVQPTVLAKSPSNSRVMREEIFGPVVSVIPFDDLEAVAAAANDTSYGLASAVWTSDVSKAHSLAKLIQAGTVWVNCQLVYDFSMPYGGYKQSGWGREYGFEGLEAYLQTKSVFVQI